MQGSWWSIKQSKMSGVAPMWFYGRIEWRSRALRSTWEWTVGAKWESLNASTPSTGIGLGDCGLVFGVGFSSLLPILCRAAAVVG
ncbi:hypothetical protein GCM10010185_71240 [Saccharothrix coeruleofusca]|uniref:Uncharacterized protein n=1 Tax=Saccharothrix coeruleofusca TaxID=33919 RepID=A0A918ATW4_9PSEU|nr:hypothetical protein GCM10010185_71240 [Saccharothrix coeruleofusca]